MNRTWTWIGTAGACLLVGAALAQQPVTKPSPSQATPKKATSPARPDQAPVGAASNPAAAAPGVEPTPDEKAILAATEAFIKAYNAGDAKAIAELYTDDAELIDEDGGIIEGRPAIQEVYASLFKENPGDKIEVQAQSLKFFGGDAAKEEGIARTTSADGGEIETGRYTVLYIKKDGRWRQASVREYSDKDMHHHENLKPLEWLVGDWVNESADAVVRTSCRWAQSKNFLIRDYTIQVAGRPTMTGMQVIGWDPLTKQVKSWVFDSQGGYGEGLWSRADDQWMIKATGVLHDGRTASATQVLTYVNKDTAKWKSVDRTHGAEVVEDIDEYTLVRKPPQPK
jgi:uncharacterized protein (TIGR02246 family)